MSEEKEARERPSNFPALQTGDPLFQALESSLANSSTALNATDDLPPFASDMKFPLQKASPLISQVSRFVL